MKPTKEQQDIIQASKDNKNLKVVARAGTGKSSTIRMLSEVHSDKSLYVVFNKALSDEASAKFPSHVDCRNIHSLAYGQAAEPIKHKLRQNVRNDKVYINRLRTLNELVNGLKIKDMGELSKHRLASMLMEGMRRWEYSAGFEITKKLLPQKDVHKMSLEHNISEEDILNVLTQLLKEWWEKRINPNHPAIVEHNTYVKIWQLSKPKLNYKIIYLDEAQDLFNVFYQILSQQDHCKVIVVGDDKQAIYQWNGAVNALDKFKFPTLPLTQSFRYGQAVADIAVKVFPEDVKLKGNPAIISYVKDVDTNKPYTTIYRTNGRLIQDAVEAISEGMNVNIEIPVKAFREKLQAVSDFLQQKKVKHPEIAIFADIQEMVKECEEDPELKRMVTMCTKGDASHVIKILDSHKNSRKPHITFCTAHKSKGREWSQVKLANDFPKLEDGELPIAEQNLLYVAATRAIDVLQPNHLLCILQDSRKEMVA